MEDKNIDQSWKEKAAQEKETLKESKAGQEKFIPPVADFSFFVSTLAIQATIFLGQIENPATNLKEQDLPQAKFIIDTLEMLSKKTQGNLSQEENELLENLLYELRMQYVAITETKK
jgi:uncharacterized protein YjaG (DUF416 family)